MKHSALLPALLLATTLGSTSGPALAAPRGPAQGAGDERALHDIAYARGLAEELQFVDLAEEVIEGLERSGISAELGEELGLVKCDIYAVGAKNEGDATRRNELYGKALESYEEYIDKNPFAANKPEAERAYVDLANTYSRSLALTLESQLGEEAEETRKTIEDSLTAAVSKAQDLIDALRATPREDWNDSLRSKLYTLELTRGQMLHGIAKALEDGTFYFNRAAKALEDLALEAGEGSWHGLRAYLELGSVYSSQGSYDDAVTFFEFVQDQLIPRSAERWDRFVAEIPREELDRMWLLASMGMPELIDAAAKNGNAANACGWGMHYYNLWRTMGFELNRPYGYLAMLATAEALLESGGWVGGSLNSGELAWYPTQEEMEADGHTSRTRQRTAIDLALSIAQSVNRDNKKNTLQIAAQNLIAEVIKRPGVKVAPDVLFEAAQGEFLSRDFPRAIASMKRILATVEDEDAATRSEYQPKVLYHIAKSLYEQDRLLEAAFAYEAGYEAGKNDPEWGFKNAEGFYKSMNSIRRSSKGDETVDALFKKSELDYLEAQKENEGDGSEILFRQAKRAYDDSDYEAARPKFLEVEPGANVYEKARVYAATCLFKTKKYPAAKAEFEDYLENYLPDPANVPVNDKQRGYRAESEAMATFYLGLIAFATDKDWERTVELLSDFNERFPDQTSYAPSALYQALQALLTLGRVDEAKRLMQVMIEEFPLSKHTGSAAFKIYELFAAEDSPDLGQVAFYLKLSNDATPDPSFDRLRRLSNLYQDDGQWAEAESELRRIVAKFGENPKYADQMQKFVLPDLGEVLLKQYKAQDALEVFAPLVPDADEKNPELRPSSATVMNYCRALSGWIEGQGSEITEVPGVGGATNLETSSKWWNKLSNTVDKWTADWLEMKFNLIYVYYQWSQLDSNKLQSAQAQMKPMMSNLGLDFRGEPENNVPGITEICGGDDTLTRRYLWLKRKLGL